MFAASILLVWIILGVAISEEGAMPKVHCSMAPVQDLIGHLDLLLCLVSDRGRTRR